MSGKQEIIKSIIGGRHDILIIGQKTNADRIRGMTDDELAEWVKLMVCKYRSCGNCPMSDWCEPDKGIAEWLKAPVEADNGT